jgi:hypothetical protein
MSDDVISEEEEEAVHARLQRVLADSRIECPEAPLIFVNFLYCVEYILILELLPLA